MVTCSCGRVMEKVPAWLEGVKVDFVCNNCPDRKVKNIAFVSLEVEPKTAAAGLEDEMDIDPDMEDDEEA